MKSLTVDDIMAMAPCTYYNRARVTELWNGHDALTVVEILQLNIPAVDRLWAVLRREVLGEGLYSAFGHVCADRAVTRHALVCGVPSVVEWAARWLSGEDRTEDAARDAVYNAAWNFTRDDAWNVARDAARNAAWSASGAARDAVLVAARAAWDAALAAAGDAERDAERGWQIKKLIKMIGETK